MIESYAKYLEAYPKAYIVLEELVERLKDLDMTHKEAGEEICRHWGVKPISAAHILRYQLESGATFMHSIGRRPNNRDKNRLQQLSDYLAFLGYSEEQAQSLFRRLKELNPNIDYIPPKITSPAFKTTPEYKNQKALQSSLDSAML